MGNVGAVIAFRPDVPASGAVDQLCRHPDPVASPADTALKHISDTQFVRDPLYGDVPAFVGKGRVSEIGSASCRDRG